MGIRRVSVCRGPLPNRAGRMWRLWLAVLILAAVHLGEATNPGPFSVPGHYLDDPDADPWEEDLDVTHCLDDPDCDSFPFDAEPIDADISGAEMLPPGAGFDGTHCDGARMLVYAGEAKLAGNWQLGDSGFELDLLLVWRLFEAAADL